MPRLRLRLPELTAAVVVGLLLATLQVTDRQVAQASATGVRLGRGTPNVVLVIADDMRADDLRFMPTVRHEIADRGVSFHNSFSPYPLCCPARASLLTGEYAHNHHVFSHASPYGFKAFDDSYTLSTALRDGGYNTGLIGKYLNGYGAQPSLVTGQPSWSYVPPGWTDWEGTVQRTEGSPATGGTYDYFNTSFNVNGTVENGHAGVYQTQVLGDKTRRLISRFHKSPKPFFIYLAPVAPHHGAPNEAGDPTHVERVDGGHSKLVTPARPGWVKGHFNATLRRAPGLPLDGSSPELDMTDKPSFLSRVPISDAERRGLLNVTRQRAEALYVLDRQLGRVIARLKSTGEYADTVLMFTSDNGYFLGEHLIRQGKVKAHEPSLQVPLVVAGPGIPHGQVRYDPISTVDLTATITDITGVSKRLAARHAPDGTSKVRTIRDGDRGWKIPLVDEAMLYHPHQAVKNESLGFDDARDSIGIRTSRYSFIRYWNGESELYDLKTDPSELVGVQDDPAYAGVLADLTALWFRYKDCAGATCRAPMAAPYARSARQVRAATKTEEGRRKARTGTAY